MAALQYHSTRNTQTLVSFKQAVLLGLSPGDGGLFVPVASQLDAAAKTMAMRLGDPLTATFAQTAFAVLKVFVGEEDVPDADLQRIIDAVRGVFCGWVGGGLISRPRALLRLRTSK